MNSVWHYVIGFMIIVIIASSVRGLRAGGLALNDLSNDRVCYLENKFTIVWL